MGGHAACTAVACAPPLPEPLPEPSLPHPDTDTCVPGTSWRQDCNTCRCTPAGGAACTKKHCLGLPKLTQVPEPAA